MAYTQSKTSALQTAIKASVDLAVAFLNAGIIGTQDEVNAVMGDYQDQFTAALYPMVDADNAAIAKSGGSGGGFRSNNRAGGGSNSTFSAQEAADTVLNFGAFQGLTIGQVYAMDASEAAAYSTSVGKTYTKSGQDWLRWAAANKDPKGNFVRVRAQAVLDNPPQP
jgi:hypothetical protein